MSIHFYDSASPENIPSGSYAAVYANGYAWSQHDIDRMARIIRIAVGGDPVYWAHKARVADCEPGAYSVEDTVRFCVARHEAGHHDFTAYANLSTMQGGLVSALKATRRPFRLWVAEWDGKPQNRPVVDGEEVWAKQYETVVGRYDLSVLYGGNSFIRP